jgi:hypothetical protein
LNNPMIAIVSSTLAPSAAPSHDGPRTNIEHSVRIDQTVETVCSLRDLGFSQIFIGDNSPIPPPADVLARLAPAVLYWYGHYPYRNKGLAEAFLLAALCDRLPDGAPIMKISGRYRASRNLVKELGDADLAGRFSPARVSELSTRAYAVRDRNFLRALMLGALDEMYAAPWRVVGPRSLLSLARKILIRPNDPFPYSDPPGGLEIAAVRWLVKQKATVRKLDELGVEGVLGSWINPPVKE